MLKQPDCATKILMIASGLPRFNSRHHSLSGGTIASVPILCVHTGISCSPRAWSLWPELASASAGDETSASAAPAQYAILAMIYAPPKKSPAFNRDLSESEGGLSLTCIRR